MRDVLERWDYNEIADVTKLVCKREMRPLYDRLCALVERWRSTDWAAEYHKLDRPKEHICADELAAILGMEQENKPLSS